MTDEEKELFNQIRDSIADSIIKSLETYKPKDRCPVCDGRGQVHPDFYTSYEQNPFKITGGTAIFPVTCRSCRGSGLV